MNTYKANKIVLLLSSLAIAFAHLSGCNVVTPIAYAIHGPEKVMPAFNLSEHAKTVIFVDDPSSQITQRRLRYTIADRATKELLAKRVLVDMLDPRGILTAASNERHGDLMSIAELGKSVGADIVIYAVITDFSMSPETGSYIPRTTMRIKIIDVATGERIWPSSEKGHLANIQIPQKPGSYPNTTGDKLEVQQQLAQRTGLGLAQLFYKHEIQETVLFNR